jgi:hypothetical protein
MEASHTPTPTPWFPPWGSGAPLPPTKTGTDFLMFFLVFLMHDVHVRVWLRCVVTFPKTWPLPKPPRRLHAFVPNIERLVRRRAEGRAALKALLDLVDRQYTRAAAPPRTEAQRLLDDVVATADAAAVDHLLDGDPTARAWLRRVVETDARAPLPAPPADLGYFADAVDVIRANAEGRAMLRAVVECAERRLSADVSAPHEAVPPPTSAASALCEESSDGNDANAEDSAPSTLRSTRDVAHALAASSRPLDAPAPDPRPVRQGSFCTHGEGHAPCPSRRAHRQHPGRGGDGEEAEALCEGRPLLPERCTRLSDVAFAIEDPPAYLSTPEGAAVTPVAGRSLRRRTALAHVFLESSATRMHAATADRQGGSRPVLKHFFGGRLRALENLGDNRDHPP